MNTKKVAAALLSMTLLVGITGCSSKHPYSKEKLLEEAESVAYGQVKMVGFDSSENSSSVTVKDKEYGFEFTVSSEVGTVHNIGFGTATNLLTGKPVETVYVDDNFYTEYITSFFTTYADEIGDIENRYSVDIPDPKFNTPHVNDFIIVLGCQSEEEAEEIFEELKDLLKKYDSRGYFLVTEKADKTMNGYRIGFFSVPLSDEYLNDEGKLLGSNIYYTKSCVKVYYLEPENW